jgi:tryptophan-rich sensory protein
MTKQKIVKLAAALALPLLAGLIGSLFTVKAIPTWYAALRKPAFNPPNWLFGPVWTLLYLLMGLALYRVWTSAAPAAKRRAALFSFFSQLAVNAIWTPVFFGLHQLNLALMIIVILWFLIVICLLRFLAVDGCATLLLVPYLGWVSFATVLNAFILLLNR